MKVTQPCFRTSLAFVERFPNTRKGQQAYQDLRIFMDCELKQRLRKVYRASGIKLTISTDGHCPKNQATHFDVYIR